MAFQNVANVDKENSVSRATPPPPKIGAAPSVSVNQSPRRHHGRTDFDRNSRSSQDAKVQAAHRRSRLRAAAAPPVVSVDVEMTDVPLRDPSRLYVKFPTTLARPVFAPIDCDSLAAISSDLAKVDIGYLREKLQAKGASMLAGLEKTKPVPADGLPKELDVVINDLSAEVPTHMLAVWSKEPHPAGQRRPVGLFPVHDVMLAANCAHLPAFPASIPPPPLTEGDTIRVPVVPLCVPHRASFGILQNYIYTRKAELVLAHLIPKPPTGVPRMQVTQVVGESLTPAALATYLMRIHGFWSNVCALGVFDDALWRVIDFAWGFVMDALKHAGNSGVRVEGVSQASSQQ